MLVSFIFLFSTETCRINLLKYIDHILLLNLILSSSKLEYNQVSGVISNQLVGQSGSYEVFVWISPNWITVDSGLLCSEIITKLISKTHVHEELLKKKMIF